VATKTRTAAPVRPCTVLAREHSATGEAVARVRMEWFSTFLNARDHEEADVCSLHLERKAEEFGKDPGPALFGAPQGPTFKILKRY
jgi:hypothetical protein